MGNANSAQPSKTQKDRKNETTHRGSADNGKGRGHSATTSGRATDQSSRPRDFSGNNNNNCRGPRATNPFIIFFLRLRSKKPKEPVTVIARAAGRLWGRMTPEQRKKYVDLANAEKKRRQDRKRKRKRSAC